MRDLEFHVTSDEEDALTGKLVARGAQDRQVTINVVGNTENLTTVRVRVGMFGDEQLSRQVLEQIRLRLRV